MAPKRTTRSTPVTPTPNATTTTTVTEAQLQALIDQGVAAAMAEAEASRVRNGYDNNGSGPRPAQAVRECSYSEFLKCKPLDFKGTEGVVGLTRWFEKMESVFSISNCTATSQVNVNKKISTLSERQDENKRELNNTSKDNQNQQQPNKRQNTGKAYTAGHREKKYYGGSKPLCPKCNYHHDGPCAPKCHRCNKVGHLVHNCKRPTNDNQRGTGTSQKVNCYECKNQSGKQY
ncbi:putative reverse transcriptase domain-containing protein [Tanacetum coccineum]